MRLKILLILVLCLGLAVISGCAAISKKYDDIYDNLTSKEPEPENSFTPDPPFKQARKPVRQSFPRDDNGTENNDLKVIEPPPPAVPSKKPDPWISPRERFLESVSLLNLGEEARAKKILETNLRQDPNHQNSALLLKQINKDPIKFFGKKYFQYKLKPNETLSKVAQRFLGTKYKFYALARYNDIAIPNRVRAGTIIKVPGEAPKPAADKVTFARVKKLIDKGEIEKAISVLEEDLKKFPGHSKITPLAVDTYLGYAEYLLSKDRLDKARRYLLRAKELDKHNSEIDTLLSQIAKRNQEKKIQEIVNQAQQQLEEGNSEGAFDTLENGWKQFPHNSQISQLAVDGYSINIEKLVEDGELEKASEILKRGMKFDPSNPKFDSLQVRIEKVQLEMKEKQAILNQARQELDNKKFPEAMNTLENGLSLFPNYLPIVQLTAQTYVKYAKDLATKGKCDEMNELIIIKAKTVTGDNIKFLEIQEQCNNIGMGRQLYEKGLKHLESGEQLEALLAFKKAVDLNPSSQQAQEHLKKLTPNLTEKYSRSARSAYNLENLEIAYCNWDMVLRIDPGNENAQIERNKSENMKCKLDNLNGLSCGRIDCSQITPSHALLNPQSAN
jgi:tetratricopeptide (TPR) repeat protein